jgi:hypothetical protein
MSDLAELVEDLDDAAYWAGHCASDLSTGTQDLSRADKERAVAREGLLSTIKRITAKHDRATAAERKRFDRATKLSRAELKRLVAAAQRAVESKLPEDEPDYTAKWVYEEAIQLAWRSAIIAVMAAR